MDILLSTTNEITGYKINKMIGIVCGEAVISTSGVQDTVMGWKATFGGKLNTYSNLMQQSRKEAEDKLLKEALSYDADAIIGVKYTTSSIMQGTSEIMVYGTAVTLEKI